MATLNTLRTRGGIIVSVVIGIALVAFLLGDLASPADNMMNSNKMRVGEIDGNKVGYVEFANTFEYYTQVEQFMTGRDALSTTDQEAAREVTWQHMIAQYVMEPGFEKLGVTVSETEQVDMVSGVHISPVISQTFVNPEIGAFDPTLLSSFVSNLSMDASGRSNMVWNYLKDQMNKQRLFEKYMTLIQKGMYVTDMEVEQELKTANILSDARYVMQEYTSVPDSTVQITSNDIRNFYNKHKNIYRQNGYRDIEYVLFNVIPSEADYAAVENQVNEMAQEFAASETPFQYATFNSNVQPDRRFLTRAQLSTELANFAFGPDRKGMYGPVRNGDTYTMARVAEVKMLPDSIGARHILLQAGQTAQADSIVTALRRGASFADLSNTYSLDQAANTQGGDLGVFSPEMMVAEFSDAIVDAKRGEILTVTTPFGLHVVEVTYKSSLTEKVQMAQITYNIEPSETTQQQIYGDVSAFIGEASGSYDNFSTAAAANNLSKRVARVRNTDRSVIGLDNSRELIRWAFNAKNGAVSEILEIDGDYVIATMTGGVDDGIAPVENVSADIASRLRLEKKADMIAQQLAGYNSLAEAESALGSEIKEISDVDFNSFFMQSIGVELKMLGAVSTAKLGALSKPVVGAAGVYLFEVTNRVDVDNTDAENERVRQETSVETYLSERANQAIVELSNIKDNRVKFF